MVISCILLCLKALSHVYLQLFSGLTAPDGHLLIFLPPTVYLE